MHALNYNGLSAPGYLIVLVAAMPVASGMWHAAGRASRVATDGQVTSTSTWPPSRAPWIRVMSGHQLAMHMGSRQGRQHELEGDERSRAHARLHAVPWMQLHPPQGHGQECGHTCTSRRDRTCTGHGHQRGRGAHGAATLACRDA